jgi:hypothetical protein
VGFDGDQNWMHELATILNHLNSDEENRLGNLFGGPRHLNVAVAAAAAKEDLGNLDCVCLIFEPVDLQTNV